MTEKRDLSEIQIATNPAPRTPCVLVLDVSGSMNDAASGTGHRRIDELNEGIRALHAALRGDPDAIRRVEIALVTVGGPESTATLAQDFSTVDYFEPPVFEAGGGTPLGEGVITALEALDTRRRLLRRYGRAITRPWMFVLSDGEPTDEENVWQAAVTQAKESVKRGSCLVYPLLIEGTRNPRLAELSEAPVTPLRAAKFVEFFRWVSAVVSRPIRSESDVPDPGAFGEFSNPTVSGTTDNRHSLR
jgi:uncharacterized protein YegL